MNNDQNDSEGAPSSLPPIRVAMIDDQACMCDLMDICLKMVPDMVMVGTAGTCREGLAMIREQKPDVLVQDVYLANENGLDMIPEAREIAPDMKYLVVSGYSTSLSVLRAMRYGVSGYVNKLSRSHVILDAIRQVARGHKVWDETILMGLARVELTPEEGLGLVGMEALSGSERQVAHLIAEGMTNEEVGGELYLAEKTIRNKVSVILEKLQVSSRSQVASLYIKSVLCPSIPDPILSAMMKEAAMWDLYAETKAKMQGLGR